jgi:hypothetical protein
MDPIVRQSLVRRFYFSEALAVYENFYKPLVSTYKPASKKLVDPGRHDDRPPTWVPLVFHCTTLQKVPGIFEEGLLTPSDGGTVSFTEIPIGELDRMKYRHREKEQIAIGFPRRYIESIGLTPVLYLQHNPLLRELVDGLRRDNAEKYESLRPFLDTKGDVSAFQEVRTKGAVDIKEAVWLLTTKRDSKTLRPVVPDMKTFEDKFGKIPTSYWHRSHQLGVLAEWQFISWKTKEASLPRDYEFVGEHYWRQDVSQKKELNVTLPAHEKKIIFETINWDQDRQTLGPFRFIDVARFVAKLLKVEGEELDAVLQYRFIQDVASI